MWYTLEVRNCTKSIKNAVQTSAAGGLFFVFSRLFAAVRFPFRLCRLGAVADVKFLAL